MSLYRGSAIQTQRQTRVVFLGRCLFRLLIICSLHFAVVTVCAKPQIRTDNATEFFTNVATRLLKSELNIDLNRIQLYPTNQYTPSVHRLLQVAANLYDATTNRTVSGYPYLPSVFRPLFTQETATNGNFIFISGFTDVTNVAEILDPGVGWHDLSEVAAGEQTRSNDMFYGVPLVVGAKTGLPNFNEFAMQTSVRVTRQLEFRRKLGDEFYPPSETNQMYTLSISNVFEMEAWNSYSNAYPRPLQMRVFMDMYASLWETNEATPNVGTLLSSNLVQRLTPTPFVNLAASNWPGFVNPNYAQASFQIPFYAPTNSFNYISNLVYRSTTKTLEPLSGIFERNQGFPIPRWYLLIRTRLRYYLIDTGLSPNRLVDIVNLDSTDAPLDIAQILASDGACLGSYQPDGKDGTMWCTNRMGGNSIRNPTMGIEKQIGVGLDLVKPQDWNNFQSVAPAGLDRGGAIDFFRAQFWLSAHYYPGTRYPRTNVFYAPFAPTRTIYYRTSWQANDPLVHYTVPDLTAASDGFRSNRISFVNDWVTNNLGTINRRYEPWGGNPSGAHSSSPTRVDPAFKDPMITKSSDWMFPTNQVLAPGWLGRVHRGTPWQTLYLKSASVERLGWQQWLGGVSLFDADRMSPTRDWHIASLLASLFNTTDEHLLLSANRAGTEDYEAVMDGFVAWTNAASLSMEPILISSNSPQAGTLAAAIKQAQLNMQGGRFSDLGDIFAVSELSFASPFLNTINTGYPFPWPTDQAYEAIPSQLLSVLRADPVLSVTHPDGTARLHLTGMEGSAYVLQTSSNLLDWVSVSTNVLVNGAIDWVFPDSQGQEPRFFRASLE